jgi:hypothetical protein
MVDLLNFEEQESYEKELDRNKRREDIHNQVQERKKKFAAWNNYKIKKFGRKPIG